MIVGNKVRVITDIWGTKDKTGMIISIDSQGQPVFRVKHNNGYVNPYYSEHLEKIINRWR